LISSDKNIHYLLYLQMKLRFHLMSIDSNEFLYQNSNLLIGNTPLAGGAGIGVGGSKIVGRGQPHPSALLGKQQQGGSSSFTGMTSVSAKPSSSIANDNLSSSNHNYQSSSSSSSSSASSPGASMFNQSMMNSQSTDSLVHRDEELARYALF
jgi:hypothetical protein